MRLPHLLLFLTFSCLALCVEDYYKLLGIDKTAGDREIKKAYKRLSKQFHPDKNPGDEDAAQKFVELGDAYGALSDPETRSIYDRYGHEGVKEHLQRKNGPGGGANPFDLFSRFFGGSGHFGNQGERRGPNMEVRLAVPLRDFYMGAEKEFQLEKQVICDACEGSGSRDGRRETCGECHGRGMVTERAQLAPGMFTHMQRPCGACGGQGSAIKNPCKICSGNRVIRQNEMHTIHIQPGMPKGMRVMFENEADEHPDHVAGDLIVQLVEHDPVIEPELDGRSDGTFFRRKNQDLFWREILSLREAWMGDWTRNVTHFDGHVVQLSRKRGEVVQPGTVEAIKGEGMPIYKENREADEKVQYGSLHVEYVVVLPDQMESGMEKDFRSTWDKWRAKKGVRLDEDSGRPPPAARGVRDEL